MCACFAKSFTLKPPASGARGFTLVELMVTVVILAILAVVALPAYRQYVTKSRRSDAFVALATIQQAQERWRANHPSYTTSLVDLRLPAEFSGQHYALDISAATARGYTITASAIAGGLQASDTDCQVFKVEMVIGNVKNSATNANGADKSDVCWPK